MSQLSFECPGVFDNVVMLTQKLIDMTGIPFQKENGDLRSFEIPESDFLFFQFFSDPDERKFVDTKHVHTLLLKLEMANRELKRLGASEEFLEKTKVAGDEPGDESNQEHNPLSPYAPVLKP